MRPASAVLLVAVLGFAATYVSAECANACNGHGECSTRHDYCICFPGWMGNSCDQRTCPRALAYIDSPVGDLDHDNSLESGGVNTLNPMYQKSGAFERYPTQLFGGNGNTDADAVKDNEGHFYAECANRGLCDRATGLCSCFTGYEGAACNRTVCVNDCSGHGTCQILAEVVPSNIHYRLWESDMTQVCKCDGGYFGVDCSQKKCMKNDDPLTDMSTKLDYNYGINERNEVQWIDIKCPFGGDFVYPKASLVYTDAQFGDVYETAAFDFTEAAAAANYKAALKKLPNQVLADSVDPVRGDMVKVTDVQVLKLEDKNHYRVVVTFNELLGDVPTLSAKSYFKCQGGAEVVSDFENVGVAFTGDGPSQFLKYVFAPTRTVAVHTLSFQGASTGTFTLSYNGESTGIIDFTGLTSGTTDAPVIQAALALVSTITVGGGSVTVTAQSASVFAITFTGVASPYYTITSTGNTYGMLTATSTDVITTPQSTIAHTLTFATGSASGSATMSYGGLTSGVITVDTNGANMAATGTAIQGALNALASINANGGSVVVTPVSGTIYTVVFTNVVSPLTAITYTAITATTGALTDDVNTITHTVTFTAAFTGTSATFTYGGVTSASQAVDFTTPATTATALATALNSLASITAGGGHVKVTSTSAVAFVVIFVNVVSPFTPISSVLSLASVVVVAESVTDVITPTNTARTAIVYDESGAVYSPLMPVTVAPTTGVVSFPTGSAFKKEAAKVTFALGGANIQVLGKTTVNIHVQPRITVSNPTFALQNAVQTLAFSSSASSGTYRLAYNGAQTGFITYTAGATNAAANSIAMKTALNSLNTIYPGYVTVSADVSGVVFTVTFFGVDSSYTQFITKVTTLAGTLPTSVTIKPSVPATVTVHTLTLSGVAAAGTVPLSYGGLTTTITWTATASTNAAAIQTALAAMSTVKANGGGVTVTATSTTVYVIMFNFAASPTQYITTGTFSASGSVTSTDTITNPAYYVVHTVQFTSSALAGDVAGDFTVSYGASTSGTINFAGTTATTDATAFAGALTGFGLPVTVSVGSSSTTDVYTLIVTFTGYATPYNSIVVTPVGSAVAALSATATDTISTPASSVLHSLAFTTPDATYTLTYGGLTTSVIAWAGVAATDEAAIRVALNQLSSITMDGGYAVVTSTGATTLNVRVYGTSSSTTPSSFTYTGVAASAGSMTDSTPVLTFSTIHTVTFSVYGALVGGGADTYSIGSATGTTATNVVYSGVPAADATALQTALQTVFGASATVTVTASSATVFVATVVGATKAYETLVLKAVAGGLAAGTYNAAATITDVIAPVVPSFGVVHTLAFTGTSGTLALSFGGSTTAPFLYKGDGTDATVIQTALNALPSVSVGGGVATVAYGGVAGSYIVTYSGVAAPFNKISYVKGNSFLTAAITGLTDTPLNTYIATRSVIQVLTSQSSTSTTLSVTSSTGYPGAGFSSYDVIAKVFCVNTGCTIARLFLNGEIMGLFDATVHTPVDLNHATSLVGAGGGKWNTLASIKTPFPTKGALIHRVTAGIASSAVERTFLWASVKAPLVYTNLIDAYTSTAHPDAGLTFSFWQNVAVTAPVNLVLKISSVSGVIDQYQWKIAGDWDTARLSDFQAARDVTTTANICLATKLTGTVPSACNSGEVASSVTLDAWHTYLAHTTQDDAAHREINRLRIAFAAVDNDSRDSCLGLTHADYYYFQFGSNGINDAPECSDRGVCDYSSGICKCFKGYAGIDCTAQNALATGAAAA